MSSNARNFFTKKEQEEIIGAIRHAEHNTSGEVRVHLENICRGNVLDRAAYLFGKLRMHKTQLRNGILFYLSVHDHKFAIIGDSGINKLVPADFWDQTKEAMLEHFKKNEYAIGLIRGITMAGEQLKKYFPYQQDDVNELPDELSFGKDN
jgi:uncharacterized membrane protein